MDDIAVKELGIQPHEGSALFNEGTRYALACLHSLTWTVSETPTAFLKGD